MPRSTADREGQTTHPERHSETTQMFHWKRDRREFVIDEDSRVP